MAVEKGCRLVGVNLNNCRVRDELCPPFFANVGALFVPFSPRIIAEALVLAASRCLSLVLLRRPSLLRIWISADRYRRSASASAQSVRRRAQATLGKMNCRLATARWTRRPTSCCSRRPRVVPTGAPCGSPVVNYHGLGLLDRWRDRFLDAAAAEQRYVGQTE